MNTISTPILLTFALCQPLPPENDPPPVPPPSIAQYIQFTPSLEIEGGYSDFDIGQLIRLKVSGPPNTRYTWKLYPEVEGFFLSQDKTQLILSSRQSIQILVIVSASIDNYDPIILEKTLNIGMTQTQVPNAPVLLNRIQEIPSKQEAVVLAQVFKQVATLIQTGAITTPSQLITTTASLSKKQLAQNFENWQGWFTNLGEGLDKLNPQSMQQYQQIWLDVANFLER